VERQWLRWYDRGGQWLPTPTEQETHWADRERQRADQEKQRAERLAAQLRALGVEPEGEGSSNFMILRPIQSYSI